MRKQTIINLFLFLIYLLFLNVVSAQQSDVLTTETFYNTLAPYGIWEQRSDYGLVWVPRDVPLNWHPYTNGHWVYTDEYGWTWISDYEWGWAPFHYGRWVNDSELGWSWIPGTVWSPAWVSWREGDNMIGWAPLPPREHWREAGLANEWDNVDADINVNSWTFVRDRDFAERNILPFIFLPAQNVTFLGRTRNITRYESINNKIVNRSFAPDRIEKAIGKSVAHFRIIDKNTPARTPISGNEVKMFRPAISTVKPIDTSIVRKFPSQISQSELDQMHSRELQNLQAQHQAEREKLIEFHQNEIKNPPPGISPETFITQHKNEQLFQINQQQSEMRQLQQRNNWEQRIINEPQNRRK